MVNDPAAGADNWLELSRRLLVEHRGVREVKDAMSRDVLAGLDEAGIQIASATYDIVGPPIHLSGDRPEPTLNSTISTAVTARRLPRPGLEVRRAASPGTATNIDHVAETAQVK